MIKFNKVKYMLASTIFTFSFFSNTAVASAISSSANDIDGKESNAISECQSTVGSDIKDLQNNSRYSGLTISDIYNKGVVSPNEGACIAVITINDYKNRLANQRYDNYEDRYTVKKCFNDYMLKDVVYNLEDGEKVTFSGNDAFNHDIMLPEYADENAIKVFAFITRNLYKNATSPQFCPALYEEAPSDQHHE